MRTIPRVPLSLLPSAFALACRLMASFLAAFLLLPGFALAAPGDLDAEFDAGIYYSVHASAVQADGKVLVGGSFQ